MPVPDIPAVLHLGTDGIRDTRLVAAVPVLTWAWGESQPAGRRPAYLFTERVLRRRSGEAPGPQHYDEDAALSDLRRSAADADPPCCADCGEPCQVFYFDRLPGPAEFAQRRCSRCYLPARDPA